MIRGYQQYFKHLDMNTSNQEDKKRSKVSIVRVIIALMLILSPFFVYSYIHNYIGIRDHKSCFKAESDAHNIAAAIADYFSISIHTAVPTINQIEQIGLSLTGKNTAVITGTDPKEPIIITVTNGNGNCPLNYQNTDSGWDGNNYYLIKKF